MTNAESLFPAHSRPQRDTPATDVAVKWQTLSICPGSGQCWRRHRSARRIVAAFEGLLEALLGPPKG